MKEILVLCPQGVDAGLLSKAYELSGGNLRVLVPMGEETIAAGYGAKYIHTIPILLLDEAAFASWLAEKIKIWGSTIVLAPATIAMRNIMPILAWKLNAGLTADCTALEMAGEELLQTRPAFGNSLMASIRSLSPIQMATVRPGAFRPMERKAGTPEIIPESGPAETGNVKELSFAEFAGGKPLTQADVIIAGGMGVGSKEGFEKLSKLASLLGAGLAASRSAVDAGYAPFRCQVGMTGITVCPRLYIAVGISGAVQHLAGMSGSEKVIAINSDPKAPIFGYADYGYVGDWETIIDRLLHLEEETL